MGKLIKFICLGKILKKMMLLEWEMLMFFFIILMMLKMLEEIYVVKDLMIVN